MPLFALPLAPSSTTQHAQSKTSRVQFSSLPVRKRKRSHESTQSSDEENPDLENEQNGGAAASTNPLSLTPAEIAQYRLAGLELDEEVPDVKGFPHRALPRTLGSRDTKGKGKARARRGVEDEIDGGDVKEDLDEKEEAVKRPSRGSWLRNQHLSVLTTILHRCLQEGDIQRASRAWAMLLRVQISGKGIDIRSSGYWQVGAGLLMRCLDKKRKYSYDEEEEEEEEDVNNDGLEDIADEDHEGERRWGSKEGLEKAKNYYERLILEFPYNRQFQHSVSALDFWPAMVGCEIYGIQMEQKEELRRVEQQEEKDDEQDGSADDISDSEDGEEDAEEDIFTMYQRRKERRRKKRAGRRWLEREEVRQTALTASEKITARLDELMATPPYSDSHNMLRLRGMLALYIGDLSVPAMPLEDDDQDEVEHEEVILRRKRLGTLDKNTERRFLFRQRVTEHERGRKRQSEERKRAAKMFDKILRDGGENDDIRDFSLGQDEQVDVISRDSESEE